SAFLSPSATGLWKRLRRRRKSLRNRAVTRERENGRSTFRPANCWRNRLRSLAEGHGTRGRRAEARSASGRATAPFLAWRRELRPRIVRARSKIKGRPRERTAFCAERRF